MHYHGTAKEIERYTEEENVHGVNGFTESEVRITGCAWVTR